MFFFLFMLAGAYMGNCTIKVKSRPWWDAAFLVLSLVLFYGIQIMGGRIILVSHLQLLTLIPLLGVAIYGYKLCCAEGAVKMMHTRFGWYIRLIAGLCLEAYLVQVTLIPLLVKSVSSLFPFSLLITFIVVIVVAYLTRCFGRVFSQVFEKEDMNWKKVFELVG